MKKTIEVDVNVGDIVWVIKDGKMHMMMVDYIYINRSGRNRYHARNSETKVNFRGAGIGRDVFERYDEAVTALRKMEQEGNNGV